LVRGFFLSVNVNFTVLTRPKIDISLLGFFPANLIWNTRLGAIDVPLKPFWCVLCSTWIHVFLDVSSEKRSSIFIDLHHLELVSRHDTRVIFEITIKIDVLAQLPAFRMDRKPAVIDTESRLVQT